MTGSMLRRLRHYGDDLASGRADQEPIVGNDFRDDVSAGIVAPRRRADWDDLERSIVEGRPELLADLARSNESWQRARTEINEVISTSVSAWGGR